MLIPLRINTLLTLPRVLVKVREHAGLLWHLSDVSRTARHFLKIISSHVIEDSLTKMRRRIDRTTKNASCAP